jgi:hypothetical protein
MYNTVSNVKLLYDPTFTAPPFMTSILFSTTISELLKFLRIMAPSLFLSQLHLIRNIIGSQALAYS